MAEILEGAACAHAKDGKRKTLDQAAAFSILTNNEDNSHNFLAPDARTASVWVDGLRFLLGQEPRSGLAEEELNSLLDMEIRIRLLPLEGIDIPAETPPVPPMPLEMPA